MACAGAVAAPNSSANTPAKITVRRNMAPTPQSDVARNVPFAASLGQSGSDHAGGPADAGAIALTGASRRALDRPRHSDRRDHVAVAIADRGTHRCDTGLPFLDAL